MKRLKEFKTKWRSLGKKVKDLKIMREQSWRTRCVYIFLKEEDFKHFEGYKYVYEEVNEYYRICFTNEERFDVESEFINCY